MNNSIQDISKEVLNDIINKAIESYNEYTDNTNILKIDSNFIRDMYTENEESYPKLKALYSLLNDDRVDEMIKTSITNNVKNDIMNILENVAEDIAFPDRDELDENELILLGKNYSKYVSDISNDSEFRKSRYPVSIDEYYENDYVETYEFILNNKNIIKM